MIPNPTLATWVGELFQNLQGKGGLPDRFEVWYAGDDGHERLNTLRIDERTEDEADLPALFVQDIWKDCEAHAATLPNGTLCRYAIQVFRDKDDRTPEATHHTLCTGSAQSLLALGSSVAAERGQLIRHNETLHGFMMTMTQAMSGRLARDLEDERMARRAAERRVGEVSEMREQLLDRQHERRMEEQREERSNQRLESILATLAALAPAVLARLGTNKPSDEASRAMLRDRVVGQIMNNLNSEDIQRIAMSLRPELQPAFLEVLASYSDDQKKQQSGSAAPHQNGHNQNRTSSHEQETTQG